MRRRRFLASVGGAAAGLLATARLTAAQGEQGQRTPNIILIIADDLGYSDLSCYGGKDIDTPHLDQLAEEGVRFTQFYTAAPMCAPTRESIMSGRYPLHTGHRWPSPSIPVRGMPLSITTLPELLRAAGCHTAIIGKWHLGYDMEMHPLKQGFDEFYGIVSGSADYYTHKYKDGKKWFHRQDRLCDDKGYFTDLLTKEAVAFVERQGKQPFFLYLAYTAPHLPDQAPEEYLKRSRCGVFGAMVACMEDGIGRLLDALERKGLKDNTLIIFTSDNGGRRRNGNLPLRGGKGHLWEGGIRVPFIARWPGHIPPGTIVDEPAVTTDLFTTLARVGGGALPKDVIIDGRDILPVMQGKAKSPHDYLCWFWHDESAIREGKMKLFRQKGKPSALFDLEADVSEEHDIAPQNPEIVKDLSGKLDTWIAEVWNRGK